MSFILFVSKKFLSYNRESKFISSISLIAAIGIMLGVAVLIIALTVIDGFQSEIQNKISSFYSHIELTAFEGQRLEDSFEKVNRINKIAGDEICSISPFLGQVAIIRSSKNKDGIFIKGLLPQSDKSDLRNNIISGKYSLDYNPQSDEQSLIIGKKLANKLSLNTGDKVTIFVLRNYYNPGNNIIPNIFVFRISGIYESGMSEYDDITAYCNLRAAQMIFNYDKYLSGYDIKLKNIQNADSIATVLTEKMGYPYYARSIFQIHRNIFTWISLQKKPIPIILGLIIIVAVFNIISTLLMIVLDKTNAIGILKSLGARRSNIIKIFIINGLFIGLVGTISGNILGYSLLKLQEYFNIISIPEGVYFLDKVPLNYDPVNFMVVSGLSILFSFLCSLIPSYLASKINAINAIKFS